jgi:cbb3-type cytochrome oxidase maturation protein
MEALYVLLPVSIGLAVIIAIVLVLAVRSGQFEDLEGPAYRLLEDDDKPPAGIECGDEDRDPKA